ncbi:MAG: hypothetical protein RMJ55_08825, partial [Roseiflexaceae bacterium]|nr:hypothetical protein [Roseiflexaceae bacterium]
IPDYFLKLHKLRATRSEARLRGLDREIPHYFLENHTYRADCSKVRIRTIATGRAGLLAGRWAPDVSLTNAILRAISAGIDASVCEQCSDAVRARQK